MEATGAKYINGQEECERQYMEDMSKMNLGDDLKFDGGKLLMSLVQPEFIDGVAEVLTFGAEKYEANSWQNVKDGERRYLDALLRHLSAWQQGEVNDKESGLNHLKHVATNVMFLLHLTKEDK